MAEAPARGGPTLITAANTSQTLLTAGGASTWFIVRSVVVANETDSPVRVTVGVGTSNTDAAGKRQIRLTTILPNDSRDLLDGRVLSLAGHASTPDLLYVVCDTANGATVTATYVSGP